jgi:hypothetical protein
MRCRVATFGSEVHSSTLSAEKVVDLPDQRRSISHKQYMDDARRRPLLRP